VPRRIPPELCARCKGYKRLCGLPYCPILARFRAQVQALSRATNPRDVEGSSPPSIVVGERNYPSVPIFYQIPPGIWGESARRYDDPIGWHSSSTSLGEILQLRSQLVGALTRAKATDPWSLYEKEVSVAAASIKPVDSEASLEKPPIPTLRFDGLLAPQGPSAPATLLKITSNPVLPKRVEKMIWDDVSAAEAVIDLYNNNIDIYTIMKAFSLGLFGKRRNRRLVPTRWAITAVDQIISTNLLRSVRTFRPINEIRVFSYSYLGNIFTIILLPGSYEAELYEVWHPFTPWTQGAREPVVYRISERSSLRMNVIDGGYIAIRLAIAEYLFRERRQAKAIIIREITRDYYAPVGNWHIRESVRKALSLTPFKTNSLKEAIAEASKMLKSRKAIESLNSSKLVTNYTKIRRLDEYIRHS
jgi:hypothetical protein